MIEGTYDKVDTTELLTELRKRSEEGSSEVLRGAVGEQLAVFEATTSVLDVERFLNASHLLKYLRILQIFTEETGDYIVSLLITAIHQKPTGRIREEEQANHDDDGEEGLKSDRETPLNRTCGEVEAIINPVSLRDSVS